MVLALGKLSQQLAMIHKQITLAKRVTAHTLPSLLFAKMKTQVIMVKKASANILHQSQLLVILILMSFAASLAQKVIRLRLNIGIDTAQKIQQ